ncbi:hypothetical protein AVEN_133022-1 [Araneus ventricosus]|uniref:Uncharacterized protein n=1 Tax=Araneus ventricosus TaxID=182803 RepID=A0A4Y2LL04_ARAVE|nr:hypothetical protein AVEN_133022-1 [Araneus ventricosus]
MRSALRLRGFSVHSYANTEKLHLVICSMYQKLGESNTRANFDCGQLTRTTPKLATPFSKLPHHTNEKRHLAHEVRFNVYQAQLHGRSSVESGFETGALQPEAEPYH